MQHLRLVRVGISYSDQRAAGRGPGRLIQMWKRSWKKTPHLLMYMFLRFTDKVESINTHLTLITNGKSYENRQDLAIMITIHVVMSTLRAGSRTGVSTLRTRVIPVGDRAGVGTDTTAPDMLEAAANEVNIVVRAGSVSNSGTRIAHQRITGVMTRLDLGMVEYTSCYNICHAFAALAIPDISCEFLVIAICIFITHIALK